MKSVNQFTIILIVVLLLSSCSRSYDANEAIQRGDIVDLHGEITNAERLDEFIYNIQEHVKDSIRITRYTIEGDPIYYDFSYNGKNIKYKFDNSNDNYGSSNVSSTVCNNFTKNINGTIIEYKLDNCTGENAELGSHFSFEIRQ